MASEPEALKPYALLIRHSRYWLVGPFKTVDELCAWAERTQHQGNDDPRWQSIYLADDQALRAPHVFASTDPEGVENGQPDVLRSEWEATSAARLARLAGFPT